MFFLISLTCKFFFTFYKKMRKQKLITHFINHCITHCILTNVSCVSATFEAPETKKVKPSV
jgi:hypothetical protein